MRSATRGRRLNKIRHDSRTVPVREERRYGVGEDGKEYFKCWNCGFACKTGREALGSSTSEANISFTKESDVPYNTPVMLKSHWILVRTNLDGDTESEYANYSIEGSGCPFCHTLNWRGDY